MSHAEDNSPIFYLDLEEFSAPEPGMAEGLTLKILENSGKNREEKSDRPANA